MQRFNQKQSGIGLLELMLSLAIIAVLLIMATRYYKSANVNQQVSAALDMYNGVKGAVQSWGVDNPTKGAGDLPSVSGLVTDGYLPASFGKTSAEAGAANPWAGGISLAQSSGKISISMTGIPLDACEKLKTRLEGTVTTGAGESVGAGSASGSGGAPSGDCSGDSNAVTAVYNF